MVYNKEASLVVYNQVQHRKSVAVIAGDGCWTDVARMVMIGIEGRVLPGRRLWHFYVQGTSPAAPRSRLMSENPLPNANGIRVAIERLRNEVEWFRARLQVAYDRIARLETGDSERANRSDPSNKESGNTRRDH